MEYTIINLDNSNKIIITKKENNFFSKDGKKLNENQKSFFLNDNILVPEEFISNNILVIINGKNYYITKVLKNNKYFDSIFNLSSKDAFNLYYKFKNRDSLINKANDVIDNYNMKLLKKWYCRVLLFSKTFDYYSLPNDLSKKYNDFFEYFLCQVLLCLTNNIYDEEGLIYDFGLENKFLTFCNSLSNNINVDEIDFLIKKSLLNNIDVIGSISKIELKYEKIIPLFNKKIINECKSCESFKLQKKKK